jgi:hypothetical protein
MSASFLDCRGLTLPSLQAPLALRMRLFLLTMSMLKEAALRLQLEQCQIDVLMRFSRLSP